MLLAPVFLAAACAHSPHATTRIAAPSATFTEKSLYQLDSTWTNDLGRSFKLGQLQGRVQVVAMFFTSCNDACPLIVHDMQRIENALPRDLRGKVGFTLMTIDTVRDTPAALRAYRTVHKLPENSWTLLHGTPDDTLEFAALLGVKFKREYKIEPTGQFAHSNLITVLNERGEIIHQLVGLNQDLQDTVKRVVRAAQNASRIQAAHE
jgi:protein SCO1/2